MFLGQGDSSRHSIRDSFRHRLYAGREQTQACREATHHCIWQGDVFEVLRFLSRKR
jgi:hypothetical protein